MTTTVTPTRRPGCYPRSSAAPSGCCVDVEHRIADPVTNATLDPETLGEVCIRGYSVMNGLYKKERHEAFDADGWYHTGDKGYIRDGYLFFEGRLSEMIKTSGSNVAPQEIEVLLEAFEEVGTAVVSAIPTPSGGDRRRGVGPEGRGHPGSGRHHRPPGQGGLLLQGAPSGARPGGSRHPPLPSGKVDRVSLRQRLTDAAP